MGFLAEDDLGEAIAQDNAPGDPPEFKSSRSDAAHLAGFRAPELDTGGGGEDAVIELDEAGQVIGMEDAEIEPDQISRDAFHEVFKMGFNMPGLFVPVFKPLAIQEGEEPPCRAASDAVYRLLEIYYPRALMPAGETVALLAAAAPFFIAKAMVIRSIMADMREAKAAEKKAMREGQADPGGDAPQDDQPAPARRSSGALGWMDQEAA